MIVAVLSGSWLAGLPASAEPTNPVDPEEANPLEPVLKKIGTDWGVELDAERIALNPLKGTVVIRQLTVKSSPQGRFLSVPRIGVKVDWERGQIDTASIEGAELAVDVSKRLGIKKCPGEKTLGYVREGDIFSIKVTLKSDDVVLVKLRDLAGHAKGLGLSAKGERLSVEGALSITKGEAAFADGNTTLNQLSLKGEFKGRQLTIRSLSGKIGGGSVSCHGTIGLEPTKTKAGRHLECHLSKVRLKRGDFLDVIVTGDVNLTKQPASYRLAGSLDVVGGTTLRPERWGPRRVDKSPLAVDLTLKLKAKNGSATARLAGSATNGRVIIVGRHKRRSARWVEEVLQQLSSSQDPHDGGR